MKRIILLATLIVMYAGNRFILSAERSAVLTRVDKIDVVKRKKLEKDILEYGELLSELYRLEKQPIEVLGQYRDSFLKQASSMVEEIISDQKSDAESIRDAKDKQEMLVTLSSKELVQTFIIDLEQKINDKKSLLPQKIEKNKTCFGLFSLCRGKEDKGKSQKLVAFAPWKLSVLQDPVLSENVRRQYIQEKDATDAESKEAIELAKVAEIEKLANN